MGGEAPLFGAAGDVEMDMDIDLDTHGSMYAEGPFAVPTLSQGPEAQEYAGESPLCSPKKKHRVQRVDSETEPPKKRRKKKRRIVINSTYCKYDCVRRVAADWDWIEDANEDGEKGEFNVFWTDTSVAIFRVMRLQNWQRINHFPSMHTIARKVQLSNTLSKMRKMFPQHFSFSPRTWSLKSERSIFKKFCQSLPQKRTFIIKPSAGCQGKGIFLTQDPQDIDEELEDAVAQEYIQRPLLIEQKKFDIRVYCLVTSMKYPSIFMFDEGLVRLCTADYQKPSEENCEDLLMHLTNYAINKTSDKFVFNEDADHGDVGHKRDFNFLNKWLRSQGHDVEKVWARIDKVVVKTLLAAQPILSHVYTSCFPHNNDGYTCFEILGFDLLLDSQLKPWLLEVNHSPSFACYTPLDDRIKTGLVREAASILNLKNDDRIREREREKEEFKRRMDSQARRAAIKKCGGDESELKALEAKELEEERKRQEQFVIKKRADEDASLQHFRRCYPSPDPARQRLYEQFIEGAKEVNAPTSTVATVQREQESRKEREKQRERQEKEEALRRGLYRPKSPSAAKLREKEERRERERERERERGEESGGNRAKVKNDDALKTEQWQLRLDQQMERHKRRISLGPRLSVFQLRDQYTTVPMVPVPDSFEMEQAGAVDTELAPRPDDASFPPAYNGTTNYSVRLMDYPAPQYQPDPPRQPTRRDSGPGPGPAFNSSGNPNAACTQAAKMVPPVNRGYRQVKIGQ